MDNKKINSPSELLAFLEEEDRPLRRHLTVTYSIKRKIDALTFYARRSEEVRNVIVALRASGEGALATEWRSAQCYLDSIVSELRMWVELASDNVRAAWDRFCDAEMNAHDARAFLPEYLPAKTQVDHLVAVECVVFPIQRFFSTELIVHSEDQVCGICGAVYGECVHLAGEIYDGEIAYRRVKRIADTLGIAMVDQPSSKHCRMFDVDGTDTLTGVKTAEPARSKAKSKSKRKGTRTHFR